ncbi:sigma-70 family RNA polymerase sigma factor [Sediminibacillus massiliensis]|uniref:sigma-70 family RNA polymerase sigma factor n=1 Tax=Sediminibacillus massiliensis TaxID=1926277 RepID=UPI001FE853D8|nr:sigma-70 family RNA polymerase sigma factor [Sediminibacillus massiliensis]
MRKVINGEPMTEEECLRKNIGLVCKVAKKYVIATKYNLITMDDLVHQGYLGLIYAFRNYDPAYGSAFSSFAVPCIEGDILKFLRDKSTVVKIPRSLFELANQIKKQGLSDKTGKEIAITLNVDLRKVQDALKSMESTKSIDSKVRLNNTDVVTLADQIGKDNDFTEGTVQDFLSKLPEGLRTIVEMKMDGYSQKEIGSFLSVSQPTISKSIKVARKLYKEYSSLEKVAQ